MQNERNILKFSSGHLAVTFSLSFDETSEKAISQCDEMKECIHTATLSEIEILEKQCEISYLVRPGRYTISYFSHHLLA